MSGAGSSRPAGGRLAAPRSGAFAAKTGDDAGTGSVLDDALADAVKATASPADDDGETGTPAAAAPAARRKPATGRRKSARVPMPDRIANEEKGVPLQVKIPKGLHWDLKVQTTLQGSDMTRATTALLSVYTEDAELVEALIDQAQAAGKTLGEFVHDALVDVAAADR